MSQSTRDRWNAAHYKQLKFSLHPTVAETFKLVCKERGLSMASVISKFMCEYSNNYYSTPNIQRQDKTSTRRLRRKEMNAVITSITAIYSKESKSLDKIPENFKDSDAYIESERIVGALETALEFIKEVYDC